MRFFTFLLLGLLPYPIIARNLDLSHPLPNYSSYKDDEIRAFASKVRRSNPQIHRGGWEWDRLLSRYIDNNREEENALPILKAYFMSILDRYDHALKEGTQMTLFYNHKSWGSGGRMRIFSELVRQGVLSIEER